MTCEGLSFSTAYPPADAKCIRENFPMEGCTWMYVADAKYCGRDTTESSSHRLCAEHESAVKRMTGRISG